MHHLPTERLAALGDESPTAEESAHLAVCNACTAEVHAYESLLMLAHNEGDSFGLPLTRWDSISAALSAAPALERVVPAHTPTGARRRSGAWMLQAAAALLLVSGGAMLGRASLGAPAIPETLTSIASRSAATTGNADSVFFNSVEDARAKQVRAEATYQQATAFLAQFDSSGSGDAGSPVSYRSRLAALDRVITTTREALSEAPHDPVINGYYLTTLGQREATLRQMNTALPASFQVNSF